MRCKIKSTSFLVEDRKMLADRDNEAQANVAAPNEEPEFPQFAKLPLELQRKIWKAGLHGPQIVQIVLKYEEVGVRDENNEWLSEPEDWDEWAIYWENYDWTETNKRIITNHPPSILFKVCRESRKMALEKYSLCLHTKDNESCIRIDPLQDAVYLPGKRKVDRDDPDPELPFYMQGGLIDGSAFRLDVAQSIRFLAVDSRLHLFNSPSWANNFRKYTALEKLTIVLHKDRDENHDLRSCHAFHKYLVTKIAFKKAEEAKFHERFSNYEKGVLKNRADLMEESVVWKSNIAPCLRMGRAVAGMNWVVV